jgi:hypothetical protein
VSLLNLGFNAVKQDYMYCTIFVLVGFVISFYNKNLTVVLVFATMFATILSNVINGNQMSLEGFDQKDGKEKMDTNAKMLSENDGDEDDEATKPKSAKQPTKKENSPSAGKLMENLREHALDLQDAQNNIISGFQKIEPYMDRAESLIETIQKTAEDIKKMKNAE